jgi:hypothetical protein
MNNEDEIRSNVFDNINFAAFIEKVKEGIEEFNRNDLTLILGFGKPASFIEVGRFTSIMVSEKIMVKWGKRFLLKDKDKLLKFYKDESVEKIYGVKENEL